MAGWVQSGASFPGPQIIANWSFVITKVNWSHHAVLLVHCITERLSRNKWVMSYSSSARGHRASLSSRATTLVSQATAAMHENKECHSVAEQQHLCSGATEGVEEDNGCH